MDVLSSVSLALLLLQHGARHGGFDGRCSRLACTRDSHSSSHVARSGHPTMSSDISSLTIAALKEKLKSHGLKVSGKKAELLFRLQQHLGKDQKEDFPSSKPSEATPQEPTELSSLTLSSLKQKLKAAGLRVSGKKAELVARLSREYGLQPTHDLMAENAATEDGEIGTRTIKSSDENAQASLLQPTHDLMAENIVTEDGEIHTRTIKPSDENAQAALLQPTHDLMAENVVTEDGEIHTRTIKPSDENAQAALRRSGTILRCVFKEGYGLILPESGDRGDTLVFNVSDVLPEEETAIDFRTGDPVEYFVKQDNTGGIWATQVSIPGVECVDVSPPRHSGTIARFGRDKGFGFIQPDSGCEKIYFSRSEVITQNDVCVHVGAPVEYDVESDGGKQWATRVTSPGCDELRASPRSRGTILFYSQQKGFGFVTPDDGTPAVYFHDSNVSMQDNGVVTLGEGDPVEYFLVHRDDGPKWAAHLTSPGYEYVKTSRRSKGTILRFFESKGYGFIKPDDGIHEIFFHTTEVRMQNGRDVILSVGDPVEFSLAGGDKTAKYVTSPNLKYVQAPPRRTGSIKSRFEDHGFITPDDGGADIIVHWSDVYMRDNTEVVLNSGDAVEYFLLESFPGKYKATQVTRPGEPPRVRMSSLRGVPEYV